MPWKGRLRPAGKDRFHGRAHGPAGRSEATNRRSKDSDLEPRCRPPCHGKTRPRLGRREVWMNGRRKRLFRPGRAVRAASSEGLRLPFHPVGEEGQSTVCHGRPAGQRGRPGGGRFRVRSVTGQPSPVTSNVQAPWHRRTPVQAPTRDQGRGTKDQEACVATADHGCRSVASSRSRGPTTPERFVHSRKPYGRLSTRIFVLLG